MQPISRSPQTPLSMASSSATFSTPYFTSRSVHSQRSANVDSISETSSSELDICRPFFHSIFRYAFEDTVIICSFLNTILNLQGDNRFEAFQNLPSLIHLPSSDPTTDTLNYEFTVTARCRTIDGRHFLIEMQNNFGDDRLLKHLITHGRVVNRLEYARKNENKRRNEEKNKDYNLALWQGITGVYTIVLTNQTLSPSRLEEIFSDEAVTEPCWFSPSELRHTNQFHRRFEDVPNEVVFLMIGHLNKPPVQLSSSLERWCYVLKDENKSRNGLIEETKKIDNPDVVAGDVKAIHYLFERLKIQNVPYRVRESYFRYFSDHNESVSALRDMAFKKGFLEGLKESISKNRKIHMGQGAVEDGEREIQKNADQDLEDILRQGLGLRGDQDNEDILKHIAREMITQGFSSREIMMFTGLSQEQMKSL
jgi:hypothetical protein